MGNGIHSLIINLVVINSHNLNNNHSNKITIQLQAIVQVVQILQVHHQVIHLLRNPRLKTTSSTSGNLYTAGQCTWYVYDRVGGKISTTWGNANNWASAAQADGYTVNHTPEKGAILQSSAGSYGHVAYVESVSSDGSVTVSEMNYSGGPFVTDTRTISASQAKSYNYIHLS